MTLHDLVVQCEARLRQPYSVRLAHVNVVGQGWTWRLDVAIDDGGIVHASGAILGAVVRDASRLLLTWIETFGGN